LDVWEPEPEISLPLLDKVVLGSPHIAGYSYDGKLNGTEMVYQALCRHLQVPATLSTAQLVPPLGNNQLHVTPGLSSWSQVKQLIAQVYSIADDDKRLRELAASARNGKHYPLRREFHNYVIQGADPKTAEWLQTLGFGIA
jgi:erythronate-4-phosphate dehydrogenase